MQPLPDRPTDMPTTPIDPAQIGVWRTGMAITFLVLLAVAGVAAMSVDAPAWAVGAGMGALAVAGLAFTVTGPPRRHHRWRYDLIGDELLVERGVHVQVRTVVPLARVQHIDVAQGPLERRAGLSRLVVHTAGTGSSDVAIPGLRLADAEALRDRIRGFIRQDVP